MEIIVNKKMILNRFLVPISKFTDQATLTLTKDSIDCISYTTGDKQTIILYTKLDVKTDITENDIKLNIGSIKRLISAFNCIPDDIIALTIDNNSITYVSTTTNFKFHLKEDGTVERAPISVEKIKQITFNTWFSLSLDKLNEILKASTFSVDSNKIYLYCKDNSIYGQLTDKSTQNLDSITVQITDTVNGDRLNDTIPLNLDIFKIISSIKMETLDIKINTKGVMMFEIKEAGYTLQYITTALVK